MKEHPIQDLMSTTMENLTDMIDVNTIIGDPVETSKGTIIIPISKLGFGFAAGGSEFSQQETQSDMLPFGGGAGGGVSVTPIAFLIVQSDGVNMIHMNEHVHLYEKLLDLAPQAFDKVEEILSGTFKKDSYIKEKKDSMKRRTKKSDDRSGNDFMI